MATASVLPVRPAPGLWRSPAAIRRTSRTRRFSRWLRHAASPIAPARCWPQKENQNAVPILAAGETNPQRDNPLCSLEIALLPFESPSQKYRTPSSGIPTGRTARRHRRVHNQSPAHSYPRSFAAAFSNIQQDPHCPACPPRAPRSCLLRPLYKAPQTTPSDHPSAETPPPTLALSFGLSCSACLFASPKKLADILIQKVCIRGIGCRSRPGCPQSDGIGISVPVFMNAASYFASSTGKYKSVADGIYKNGTLMEPSAFSTSPPKPGVVPTSCFSQVRICKIKLLASAPGIKLVFKLFTKPSNVVPGFEASRHNS